MVDERSDGNPTKLANAKIALQHLARDHSRVPMQWNGSKHAGFSTREPWMRPNDDYTICNAKQQSADASSVLAYWKRILALRSEHTDLFVYGDFDLVDPKDKSLVAFTKQWHGSKAFVVCNFSKTQQVFEIPGGMKGRAEILMGTRPGRDGRTLLPFEGRIYMV
jgi:glycosidase